MPERTTRPAQSEVIRRGWEEGVRVRTVDEAKRTVELSFSSEAPVMRWWGPEILSHDPGCVDLTRLGDMGVVLWNHNRDEVLGRVASCTLDAQEKRCSAVVQFDDDPAADLIFRKVVSGTLKGVSVGYRVDVWEEVMPNATSTNGRFTGPCDIAMRWTPMEISIVSVPADASVGVGRSDDTTPAAAPDITTRGDKPMPDKIEVEAGAERGAAPTPATPAPPVAPVVNVDAERAAAVAAERTRISDVTELCRAFEVDPQDYIANGTDVETVRKAILAAEMKKRAPIAASVSTAVTLGEEAADKFRAAGQDALLLRAGLDITQAKRGGGYQAHDGATSLAHMSLREMMVEYLRLRGKSDTLRMTTDQLMREALTPDSQFLGMLDNTVNKAMLIGYQAAATTFQLWTGRDNLTDFKPVNRYRLSEASELKELPQHGEFQFDQMTDERVSIQLGSKGIRFAMTRQAFINDDLSYITKMPAAYTRGALRGLNRVVYAILNTNPTLAGDGKALFVSDHGNLAGTGAAVSKATLGAGRKAMRKQKNLRGDEFINVSPYFLLNPPDIETDVEQFLMSIADPASTNANVLNPFRNQLQQITDPELTDAYAWFLAAAPSQTDTISVSYLNGRDMPTLESQISWEALGMEWRMYWDYSVDVLDYRGLYKNAGR